MRIPQTALALLFSLIAGAPIGSAAEPKSPPSVTDELKALIADLNEAGARKNRVALERIYADDFLFVHSTGKAVQKAEQIDRIMSDASGYSIPVHSFEGVQVYGDIAMLRTSDGPMYGTNLYVRRGGGWQILQVQGTRKPPERKPIQLPATATDNYLGKYEFSPGRSGVVSKEGDRLRWRGGEPPPSLWCRCPTPVLRRRERRRVHLRERVRRKSRPTGTAAGDLPGLDGEEGGVGMGGMGGRDV